MCYLKLYQNLFCAWRDKFPSGFKYPIICFSKPVSLPSQAVIDSTQFETFSKYLLDQLKSIQNQLEDLKDQIRTTNNWCESQRGQQDSGLEIPSVCMIRCMSEQHKENSVDS
jgi:hypothetical protein